MFFKNSTRYYFATWCACYICSRVARHEFLAVLRRRPGRPNAKTSVIREHFDNNLGVCFRSIWQWVAVHLEKKLNGRRQSWCRKLRFDLGVYLLVGALFASTIFAIRPLLSRIHYTIPLLIMLRGFLKDFHSFSFAHFTSPVLHLLSSLDYCHICYPSNPNTSSLSLILWSSDLHPHLQIYQLNE